jgi:hypothetical protein
VSPQLIKDLAVPPARRYRPIGRLEVAHRLRPLARGRLACDLVALRLRVNVRGGWRLRGRRVRGRELLLLRGPVVNIPIVLIEETVVLVEELGGQRGEVSSCEGGKKKIGFESSTLSGLV